MTQKQHAKNLKIAPEWLSDILRKRRRCSIPLAFAIEKEYKGAIKAHHLRPEISDIIKKARASK